MKKFQVNYTVTLEVEVEKIIKSKSLKDLKKLMKTDFILHYFTKSKIRDESIENIEVNDISEV